MSTRAVAPAVDRRRASASGFTLIEVLVSISLIAVAFALATSNIGAFIPSVALDGESKQLVRWIDFVRSTARIEAKRMELELDLDRHRWRVVFPPEAKLTSDQEAWTLEIDPLNWHELENEVQLAGAGDAVNGLVRKGPYKLVFDPSGFSGDQLFVFRTKDDPDLVWSVVLHGLTGRCTVEKNENGQEHRLLEIREGSF